MPPGTGHFSQQLEKCPKEPGETKVSPLPCALCRVQNCNRVPHVRGSFPLSQRIKGLSPATAPLPLMLCHGRSVCVYWAGGAEHRPYSVLQRTPTNTPNGTYPRGTLQKTPEEHLSLTGALLRAKKASQSLPLASGKNFKLFSLATCA